MRTKTAWLLVVPYLALARPTPILWVWGAVLTALGLLVRGWSAGTIDKDRKLTTSGPYAFTRNPLYLGSFAIGGGFAIAGGHWAWPLALIGYFALVYRPAIQSEGERLERLFGAEYRAYAQEVPPLLPRLTPVHGAGPAGSGGFRWARYRRHREWEALLGAVAVLGILALRIWWRR